MVTRLVLKNFGPFESADVSFDQFNVILGTNGTGKSMLLWALRAAGRIAKIPLRPSKTARSPKANSGFPTRTGRVRFEEIIHRADPDRTMMIRVEVTGREGSGFYEVHLLKGRLMFPQIVEEHIDWTLPSGQRSVIHATETSVESPFPDVDLSVPRPVSAPFRLHASKKGIVLSEAIQRSLWDRTATYRLDPSALKAPCGIGISMNPSGYGFASYLDTIQNQPGGQERFQAMVASVQGVCPHLAGILLPTVSDPDGSADVGESRKKRIAVEMTGNATAVPVDLESDGTILMLACAALVHGSDEIETLCLEEPENGLHPSAIPHIVGLLRQLAGEGEDRKQVILVSHSYKLFSAVQYIPGVIRLVRRGSDGRSSVERVDDTATLNMIPGWAGLA